MTSCLPGRAGTTGADVAEQGSPVGTRRCGQVALVGRPNVGKSTLLNCLLGETWSIASPRPQTTRHCILGAKSGPGFQLAYVDTPGWQTRYTGALHRRMRREAITALRDTQAILFMVEALRWTAGGDALVLKLVREINVPVILVINKVDRVRSRERLLPYMQTLSAMHAYAEVIPVSARTGLQVDVLERCVVRHLPIGELSLEVGAQPLDERELVAELLREQLLYRLGDELPYCLSVRVERIHRVNQIMHIHASIHVENEGQRRIVIGHRGQLLKAAGSRARIVMERRFGQQVNLQTWVRVVRNWSDSEARLTALAHG